MPFLICLLMMVSAVFADEYSDRAFSFWQNVAADSTQSQPEAWQSAAQGLEFLLSQYPGDSNEDETLLLLAHLHERLDKPLLRWHDLLRLIILHGNSPLALRARTLLDSIANYATEPYFSIRNNAGLDALFEAGPESDYRRAYIRYLDILVMLEISTLNNYALTACDTYLRHFTYSAPDADLVLYWRGLFHRRLNKNTAAVFDFRLLQTVFPESPLIPNALYQSALTIRKSNPQQAKHWLIELLNQYPDHELSDDAQFSFAEIEFRNGQVNNALNGYRMVLKLFPQSDYCPRALYRLGRLNEDQGKFMQAVQNYRQILLYSAPDSLLKKMFTHWLKLAQAKLRDPAMEAEVRLAYVQRLPNAADAAEHLYRAGNIYDKLNKKNQARLIYNRILDDYPASKAAYKVLKSRKIKKKRPD